MQERIIMAKDDWLAELEGEIQHNGPVVIRPRAKASVQDKMTLPFFLLFLVLAIALTGAIIWKNRNSVPNYLDTSPYATYQERMPSRQQIPPYQYQNDNREIKEIRDATTKVWQRVRWNSDIIHLMAVVDNHNAAVVKNGYPKSDLIYINEDWTINRIPKYLDFTEADREFLRKFVR
jgi:hypothetical protein